MKARITIIALILSGLLSCTDHHFDANDFRDDPSIQTLNGKWKVISFEDITLQQVEFKTEENSWGYDIIVTFDDTKDPHELSGKITTNSVFGEFDYISVRQVKFQKLGSTNVNQPEWGDEFFKALLYDTVNFKIHSTRLRLYYDDQTKSVTLEKIGR